MSVNDARRHAEAVALAREAILATPEALAQLATIDGPAGPEQFVLWPHQRRVLQSVLNNKRTVVLKARQVGITWASALLAVWWAIAHPGTTTMILSIGERESIEVLRRIRRLWDSLPAGVRSLWGSEGNKTSLTISSINGTSTILSLPSSSSAGRGYTVSLLIGDEAAFWPDADSRLGAVLPTMADAGSMVLLSTADGMQGAFYSIWAGAPENEWNPVFIRADERPGRDEEWLTRERTMLGELGPQELPLTPEEAFISSGRSVFDPELLLTIRAEQCNDPPWRGRLTEDGQGINAVPDDGGFWNVWEWPERGREYLIAADVCAGGGAKDWSHAVVYDTRSWDQVAYLHGKPTPGQLARELRNAAWLYQSGGKPALLIPEANQFGQAVIALLRDWSFPRVYQHARFDQAGNVDETKMLGWYTSVKSKALAIGSLQTGLRERSLGVRDPEAIAEMTRYVLDENGRMGAAPGSHDDRVMAHAIASAVLAHTAVGAAVDRPPAMVYVNARPNRSRTLV